MASDTRLIERWLPITELGIESVRERTPMTHFPHLTVSMSGGHGARWLPRGLQSSGRSCRKALTTINSNKSLASTAIRLRRGNVSP